MPAADVRGAAPGGVPRTLDLYPTVPEFLNLVEIELKAAVRRGQSIEIRIQNWQGPQTPIDPFAFWLVVDHQAAWDFVPIGFRRYRKFVRRSDKTRLDSQAVLGQTLTTQLAVTGDYAAPPPTFVRRTPGVYWGELHGMAFNQRPLDDFYEYAKNVTKLDFCCPCLFSYNTCVENVWQEVKQAARRHAVKNQFVPIVGFECGTYPDDSHRCVYFRAPENVPPIFCDSRPPAQEAAFQRRFHPDTVICRTLDEFYRTVKRYGGIVTGHHHTRTYEREHLAEMWQKQRRWNDKEEERVYELIRGGKRFGLVGGSDTHDSMPGNPHPEPHCPSPAGLMAVQADELSLDALWQSILARRVYATSGARIAMQFQSNMRPLGSDLPLSAERRFAIEVDGTNELTRVELLRDGRPIQHWSPRNAQFAIETVDTAIDRSRPAFYLVRAAQSDGHKAWTSPIWFG